MSRRKRKPTLPNNNIHPLTSADDALTLSTRLFTHWREYLFGLTVNSIIWEGMPSTIDQRLLEIGLAERGYMLFFYDEIVENYLALNCTIGGELDIYNIPIFRQAFAPNGYNRNCTPSDSVIIFNNYLHTPDILTIELYATRMTYADMSLSSNLNMQKFSHLIKCSKQQELTMRNMYEQYSGYSPVIFASDDYDMDAMTAIPINVPFVADKIEMTKHHLLNDFLTWLGAENSNQDKRERMTTNEVGSNYGNVELSRNMRLNSRMQAAEKIKDLFGIEIRPRFNSDLSTMLNLGMEAFQYGKIYDRASFNSRNGNAGLTGNVGDQTDSGLSSDI